MAVKEVKVGQVWKWYEWSDVSFEVLEIIGNKVGIRYTGKQHSTRVNLDYWDDESVLVEDVPVEDEESFDPVERPAHYNQGKYEVIDVIEDWGLDKNYFLGNVIKYVARCAHKGNEAEDLKKARFYLDRYIGKLES